MEGLLSPAWLEGGLELTLLAVSEKRLNMPACYFGYKEGGTLEASSSLDLGQFLGGAGSAGTFLPDLPDWLGSLQVGHALSFHGGPGCSSYSCFVCMEGSKMGLPPSLATQLLGWLS